jgi:RHS repeat-associated protein
MTSDGQGTTVNLYTHLDNPVSITTPGGELQYTYDALGSALHSAAATNQNEPVERHYQGMFEYENGTLKSIYHEHGRVVYNEELEGFSGDAYAEWHISDHLGNVRVAYVDKNVDGYAVTDPSDAAANEVTATHHYYPHGMRFEGNFINPTGNDVRQEYNGIERFDDISPTLSFATYRSHDASLGRWMQIDPKAEQAGYHNSPYASMNNNPISMADPHGDLPILAAAAIGAAFSMGSTIASGMINKNLGNYNSITSAAMWGAIGGVASFGIGSAFGPTGSFLNEVGRAAAHGTSSGLQSHIQGGSFGSGFLAGSISSGLSSGATAANFGDAAMIGVGALGGGVGSSIGGGSFLGGFSQGLAVGAFNHAMHKSQNEGRRDPPTDEELLNYLAGELNNGRITPEEYTRAWYLVEDGAWGLVGHVLWENKVDIALTAGGAGLLKILSKTRVIKDGFLIGGKQLQLHRHHLNYLKGKGMSGTANVWHINIGKKHIIFNPRHWGKLTSDWWNPIR